MIEFVEFPKIPRLSRLCVVTEKIDGTQGSIYIGEDGEFLIGSRTRWITTESDNHGFTRWAIDNKNELLKLGPGMHRGEWWGQGINRNYGLKEKRFSLFNTSLWVDHHDLPLDMAGCSLMEKQQFAPDCCRVVPILYEGLFETNMVETCLDTLRSMGSAAAPGFMKPEGVVVYHMAGNLFFKKTIEKDESPKGRMKS